MKKTFIIILLILQSAAYAQQKTVQYIVNNDEITNPERGFYKYTETRSSNHTPLDLQYLKNLRSIGKTSIIFRYYYLDSFRNSSSISSFLSKITADFNTLREAGVKIIIRFAYTSEWNGSKPYNDSPSKANLLNHIHELKPIIQANSDVILTLHHGFYGVWGETFYSDVFGCIEDAPLTQQNLADRKEVLDSILTILPANRLLSVRYPTLKSNGLNLSLPKDSLTSAEAYKGNTKSRIGFHNDCFLVSENDYTYRDTYKEKTYWEADSKYTIMGGESCGDNATYTNCINALKDLKKAHWTYINNDYHPDVINRWKNEGCYSEIKNHLGYRINLNSLTYKEIAKAGSAYQIDFSITNSGFASPVNKRDVELIFKNAEHTYVLKLGVDIRKWYPGQRNVQATVQLPIDMVAGNYQLSFALPDASPSLHNNSDYSIQLANVGLWNSQTGSHNLQASVEISGTILTSANDVKAIYAVNIYPNPTSNQLTINSGESSVNQIQICDVQGKVVYQSNESFVGNKTFDVSNVTKGFHIIKISGANQSFTQKLVVE